MSTGLQTLLFSWVAPSLARPQRPALAKALLSAALCALVLTGCNSTSDNSSPGVTGAQAAKGDWLCEAGKAADDWDCIQSEDIAPILSERQSRTPAPSARPRSAPDSGPAIPEAPQPPGFIVDPEPPQSIREADPGPQPVPGPAQPLTTSSPEAPTNPSEEPAYAALAYRPDEPVRIIDLPEDFYAAQLLAVSTKAQIEEFVVEKNLYNMSAARIERNGQVLYVLLLGVYESKDTALAAVAQMPADVRELKPWVRPINGLQDAMIRADRLVATADVR